MSDSRGAAQHPVLVFWLGLVLATLGPVLVAASTVHPVAFSATRLWIGTALFGVVLTAKRSFGRDRNCAVMAEPARLVRVSASCALGGLLFGAHQVTFFQALRVASVADVMIMNALAPILVALVASRVDSERVSRRFWRYTAVSIAGTLVIAYSARTAGEAPFNGLVLAFVAMVVFTGFYLASRSARARIATLTYLSGVFLVAALTVTSYALLVGIPLARLDARNLLLASLVAVVSGGLGVALMTWPLTWLRVSLPPVMRLTQPVLAAVYAWLFLGQVVGGLQVVGGAIILVGVAGVITDGRFLGTTTLPRA